jgi:uncharacterized Zn finger protein
MPLGSPRRSRPRTLEIYQAALDGQLPHAQQSAYQTAADYLRQMRPLYEALGRPGDWPALVASIRERDRNRPNFLEILSRLEPRQR